MPGLIPMDYPLEEIFRDLYIPGNRNFLVTYDGTMWAMNGVFLGNIIGSNIIGGRINGAEIGIGKVLPNNVWDNFYFPEKLGNWGECEAPTLQYFTEMTGNSSLKEILRKFQKVSHILPDGSALFKEVYIFGGEIHLGTFHIIGKHYLGDKITNDEQEGHLL